MTKVKQLDNLTPEKIAEIKQKIKSEGYVILESVLNEKECQLYKSLLEHDYKKYSPHYFGYGSKSNHGLDNKSSEKVVFNLHNKHLEYYDLFDHPIITSVLDSTLKDGSYMNAEPYHLLNNTARCPLENSKGQQLHLDSNLPGGDYPLIMVVLWMLDDFTENNGSTRIIPKSHKFTTYADNDVKYVSEYKVIAPKGSVIIYNAALWHGSSDKLTADDRWAVILGYGRWFIKPSFDFMKNMPHEIYNELTDERKDLLGYRSNPPKDEFTRMRRRSEVFDSPINYTLPE
jgi:ectoine hydroxylase-related dioxygenase (phytanoyl-CoA dioxygenase family)